MDHLKKIRLTLYKLQCGCGQWSSQIKLTKSQIEKLREKQDPAGFLKHIDKESVEFLRNRMCGDCFRDNTA